MEILNLKTFFWQLITLQNLLTLDSRRCCKELEVKIQIMEAATAMNLLSSRTTTTQRYVLNQIGFPQV